MPGRWKPPARARANKPHGPETACRPAVDAGAALAALVVRFEDPAAGLVPYVIFTVSLPFLGCLSVALARGYDARIVGLGSDEFRRVFNAAVA